MFDTLAYVETLKASGIPDDQAKAHRQALDAALRDGVATKSDINRLEQKIETHIAEAKVDIIKWLVPLMLGQVALTVTLIKLL